MLEINFLESVTERDVDLLILEELSVSEEFRKMFSTLVFGETVYKTSIGAWHSISSDYLGESDLLFIFRAINGSETAILIENKIDALPMPEQGGRYRQRGEAGIKNGLWESFKTCIIAPKKYLGSVKDSGSYDSNISYEEIHSYFASKGKNDSRAAYKADVLLEGIEKNRRGYQPIENERVTAFVKQYFEYANEKHPELKMQEPKSRQAGSSWIDFYSDVLPPGREVTLAHQLTNGEVKLLFKEKANDLETIRIKYQDSFSGRMSIKKAGQSAAILMKVAKISPLKKNFDEVKGIIDSALDCLSQLSILYEKNGGI
jgi:hypothetical protein